MYAPEVHLISLLLSLFQRLGVSVSYSMCTALDTNVCEFSGCCLNEDQRELVGPSRPPCLGPAFRGVAFQRGAKASTLPASETMKAAIWPVRRKCATSFLSVDQGRKLSTLKNTDKGCKTEGGRITEFDRTPGRLYCFGKT